MSYNLKKKKTNVNVKKVLFNEVCYRSSFLLSYQRVWRTSENCGRLGSWEAVETMGQGFADIEMFSDQLSRDHCSMRDGAHEMKVKADFKKL